MPRGKPDYQDLLSQTAVVEDGNINLPVYLTGFSRLDGGGRVVMFEDFRSGIDRYDLSSVAPGVNPVIAVDSLVGHGFYPSVKLNPVGASGYSTIRGKHAVPVSGKMGIEFGYYFPALHGQLFVQLTPIYDNGSNPGADFRIRHNAGEFDLWTGAGYTNVFTPASGAYLQGSNFQIKIVVDAINDIYDYIMVGGYRVALGQNLRAGMGGGLPGSVHWAFTGYGFDATYKKEMYINYVIITADEP